MRLLFPLLFLTGCGVSTFKLIYDREPKVIARSSGKACERLWYEVGVDYVDEAFGPPCDVLVRRKKEFTPHPRYR